MTEKPNNIDFAECLGVILNKDIASAYPADQLELLRDSNRITQQSKQRGLPFFTIELPEIGKQLDASLSRGRLNLDGLPHTRGTHRGSRIPKLFQGLWKRIFCLDGLLREDADPTAVFFLRQLLYVAKKVELECSERYLYDTVKEFFHVEAILPPTPNLWFEDSPIHRSDCGDLTDLSSHDDMGQLNIPGLEEVDRNLPPFLLKTVQQVADRLISSFGLVRPEELIPRHGPGSVSDWSKTRDKWDFDYWSDSLQRLFPYDTFGLLNMSEGLVDSLPASYPVFRDWHSKLVDVPKTQKGPRLIAAEPTSNQWIQQAIARWLRWKSRDTLIGNMVNFFDQTPSREAALDASRSGLRATIDLKSASDRLTCWLIQRVLRSNPNLLDMIRSCRTKYMLNPIDAKFESIIVLKKFATQGSALTFPLQSVVFSILALGVGKYLNPRTSLRRLSGQVRVFGDDIVIPVTWVATFRSLLDSLWLKVNATKTHTEGNFRESCGMDAFRGHDVTPAYITSLQTNALDARRLQGAIDTQNHFYLKGLWHIASHLTRTVQQVNQFPVVSPMARVPGLVTLTSKGCYYAEQSYSVRFNQSLQRTEIRLPIFRGRSQQGLRRLNGLHSFLARKSERDLRSSARRGIYSFTEAQSWILQGILEGADRLCYGLPYQKAESEEYVRKVGAAVVRRTWVPIEDAFPNAFSIG